MAELERAVPSDEGGARTCLTSTPRRHQNQSCLSKPLPPLQRRPLRCFGLRQPQLRAGRELRQLSHGLSTAAATALVVNLKYIGYLLRDGEPVACFTDGKEVYVGHLNDIIANKYRVTKITDQSVELASLKGDQSKTIPFEGNNPG